MTQSVVETLFRSYGAVISIVGGLVAGVLGAIVYVLEMHLEFQHLRSAKIVEWKPKAEAILAALDGVNLLNWRSRIDSTVTRLDQADLVTWKSEVDTALALLNESAKHISPIVVWQPHVDADLGGAIRTMQALERSVQVLERSMEKTEFSLGSHVEKIHAKFDALRGTTDADRNRLMDELKKLEARIGGVGGSPTAAAK